MSITTAGFSEAARSVYDYQRQEESHFRDTETFGLDRRLREELADVWEDCQRQNWDGYQALPITSDTLRNAYRLLELLPRELPRPTLSAEPDGHLTLEWYRSPRRLLSVSIGSDGDLHYAALLGPNRTYGTEIFTGCWPSIILELVSKVHHP